MAGSSGQSTLFTLCFIVFALVVSLSSSQVSGDHLSHHLGELGWVPARSGCRGTITECLAVDEFELDSESSRRILATSRYISYGALQRNTVPCSRRGASYYNCRPGGPANPYTRGCNAITRCRS